MSATPNMDAVTEVYRAWAGGFFAAAISGRIDHKVAYERTLEFAVELVDAAEADGADINAGLLDEIEGVIAALEPHIDMEDANG